MRRRAAVARVEIFLVVAAGALVRLRVRVMVLQSGLRFHARLRRRVLNGAHIILIASLHVGQLGKQGTAVVSAE